MPFAVGQSVVTLVLVPGQSDYAGCAGTYRRLSVGAIRGKSIYLRDNTSADDRVIFHDGNRWVITAGHYIFLLLDGATGGFYASAHTQSDAPYANYSPRYTCS